VRALLLLLVVATPTLGVWGDEPKIIDKPIRFDEERVKLTVEYRRRHQDPEAADERITPRMIVLHYTDGDSLLGTWRYFDETKIGADRPELARAGQVNVSAHFLVDRDGTIYRLVPETTMARHAIGLNHLAIGVENVGDGKKHPLTDAQVEADAALVRWLVAHHTTITHLIGHQEADRFAEKKHPYWLERDPKYKNGSEDPGSEFLKKVRAKVADLKLDGAPP
jgi:N-acetyl-anhydromuramyl-L-alanine amidase AmpD